MDRRGFLKSAGIGAASFSLTSKLTHAQTPSPKRPNVILVMTDDQGYGDLACLGNPFVKTPNTDKLHTQSVRLTNYHVSPTCSPTRAALMTGRYNNRVGVWHTVMGRSQLRADETTMADVFKTSGYATGHFGKWHLGDNYPFRPMDRGFDTAVWHGGGGIGNTQDYWGNDYYDDWYCHNGEWKQHEGYCTDEWFNETRSFVRDKAKSDEPFFCYLATNAPHDPFLVPKKYSDRYDKVFAELGLTESQKRLAQEDRDPAVFYGMLTNIDENLGKLMDDLDELGIADNTILIFTTDNGTVVPDDSQFFYNAGMRANKSSAYDGGHRVPFFMRWPGQLEAGKDVNSLTAHIDILPTLAGLCHLQPGQHLPWDGADLSSLIAGNGAGWLDRVIVTDSQRTEDPKKWRRSAVMTDRWRLIDGDELYDMTKDAGQETDTADEYPNIVAYLREKYEIWWADTSTRFGEYTRTVIGSDHENPVMLSSHDWHTEAAQSAWNQDQIKRGPATNGFWEVVIDRRGTYEFTLRRWPKEAKEISLNTDTIKTTVASIKIGSRRESKAVKASESEASFQFNLEAGPQRIIATLSEGTASNPENSMGAYYLYAERL